MHSYPESSEAGAAFDASCEVPWETQEFDSSPNNELAGPEIPSSGNIDLVSESLE